MNRRKSGGGALRRGPEGAFRFQAHGSRLPPTLTRSASESESIPRSRFGLVCPQSHRTKTWKAMGLVPVAITLIVCGIACDSTTRDSNTIKPTAATTAPTAKVSFRSQLPVFRAQGLPFRYNGARRLWGRLASGAHRGRGGPARLRRRRRPRSLLRAGRAAPRGFVEESAGRLPAPERRRGQIRRRFRTGWPEFQGLRAGRDDWRLRR